MWESVKLVTRPISMGVMTKQAKIASAGSRKR
jgi:hypothetical protein